MFIPPAVKILGFVWNITRDPHVSDASSTYGTTVPSLQKINIDSKCTELHAEQTFFHEALHAIWWQMGLKNVPEVTEKMEEQIVHALSSGLHALLKDNDLLK